MEFHDFAVRSSFSFYSELKRSKLVVRMFITNMLFHVIGIGFFTYLHFLSTFSINYDILSDLLLLFYFFNGISI